MQRAAHRLSTVDPLLLLPILRLALPTLIAGYVTEDGFQGVGSNYLPTPMNPGTQTDAEFLPSRVKLVPVMLSLLGIGLTLAHYTKPRD